VVARLDVTGHDFDVSSVASVCDAIWTLLNFIMCLRVFVVVYLKCI
jgi:hypothetical protein